MNIDMINFPGFGPEFVGFFIILMIWGLFWKGLALWHSARRAQPWWFLALLVINTVGILEIVYLFFVAKKKTGNLFKID